MVQTQSGNVKEQYISLESIYESHKFMFYNKNISRYKYEN